jgi:hypothetical protein
MKGPLRGSVSQSVSQSVSRSVDRSVGLDAIGFVGNRLRSAYRQRDDRAAFFGSRGRFW